MLLTRNRVEKYYIFFITYLHLYVNNLPFNHPFNSHHNVHITPTHPFDVCDKQLYGGCLQLGTHSGLSTICSALSSLYRVPRSTEIGSNPRKFLTASPSENLS